MKQKFKAPLTNLHCLLDPQAITSVYTRIDAELWIQKIYHSDMILEASLHQITWYTFSEDQKPNVLSDFNLMDKAATHKRYLLYGYAYVNMHLSLAPLKAMVFFYWLQWEQAFVHMLILCDSKKYTQTNASKYINR